MITIDDKILIDYCLVSKTLIEDRLVSPKAKALYAILCNWPQGYDCSLNNLSDEMRTGKDSVSNLLKELEDYGYIERNRIRGPDGKYDSTKYQVFTKPNL